jgi:S-adenosylmethionine:tRNA ribosyltransferase-isomerase
MYSLDDYDFSLPERLIAQAPVEPRDASRLLTLHRGTGGIGHRVFREMPEILRPGDLLVANNTRVFRARMLGRRRLTKPDGTTEVGGKVEFLMLERIEPLVWEGAFHASAKYVPGLAFEVPTPSGEPLRGEIVRGSAESPEGLVRVRFDRDPIASGAGEIPLPPYIQRPANEADEERYQTIYAKEPGSAAAPTAGLHFTPQVREALIARGVGWEEITLNVGLGTFRPVKAADIRDHKMHEERYVILEPAAAAIERAKREGRRVIAVGTTVVRALESAWNPERGVLERGERRTGIFLHPGNPPRLIDGLITNFHLPKSTLMMLISAFAGRERVMAAYREAVEREYRFFSYGDAMFIHGA